MYIITAILIGLLCLCIFSALIIAMGICFRMLMYEITGDPEWSVFESDKIK